MSKEEEENLIDKIYEYTGLIFSNKRAKDFQKLIDDILINDRRRIVEPLVKCMSERIDDNATYDAVQETLKNAGVEL